MSKTGSSDALAVVVEVAAVADDVTVVVVVVAIDDKSTRGVKISFKSDFSSSLKSCQRKYKFFFLN